MITYRISEEKRRVYFYNAASYSHGITFFYMSNPDIWLTSMSERMDKAQKGDERQMAFLVARDELIEKGLITENI